jgi:tyrosyl-tRNA synthetase
MSADAFTVLEERGFIQQCTDIERVRELLANDTLSFYVGLDPTGPSLHAGHMVPLFALAHLARAGHRAIALIGGGTAQIGDPSGKTEMRKMLSVADIESNSDRIRAQVEAFLSGRNTQAEIVNNADWLSSLNYISFLRDIGRHFSVNRMLSFETYKMRLETGLSFIEFNYQLLQSYDFLTLYDRHGCTLQIGGDDQWGNIVAGVDLIRRVRGAESYGLTFPLVTRADGKKMGKSEKGAVYLDPEMYAPYDFFQYWRNVPDADVRKFLLLYTFVPAAEVDELCSREGSAINTAKERLALELTAIVHGDEAAASALEAAKAAFQAGGSDVSAIPSIEIPRSELEAGINVVDLFERSNLCASKSEARRLVSQGGARINDQKVDSIDAVITDEWGFEGELLLRAGKKRYFRILIA